MLLELVNVTTLLELSLLGWVGYCLATAVYNVYFHPLRRFPGPLAARASNGWKLYMEVFRQESPVHLLQKLHQQYGDVVRLRPNELHFSSANAYNDIYNPSARWDKDRVQYESVGADHSLVSLIPYEEAKQRKAVLKAWCGEKADRLIEVLKKRNEEGKSSDLLMAFRCMALDAATDFCFGTSLEALDAPEFRAPLLVAMDAALPGFVVMKHFPLLRKIALSLPSWFVGGLYPDMVGLPRTQEMLRQQVANVITHPEVLKAQPHPTVYQRLLQDPEAQHMHAHTASHETVPFDEANTLMFEATHTVADPSMFGLFHILSNPTLHARLLAEIRTVWPDSAEGAGPTGPPSLEVLETLPLLTATIKESLRMAPGIASPLCRITPAGGRRHCRPWRAGWRHRWWLLERKEQREGLEQWFVAFSRGPRSCPGSNLAWCEMYILLSTMLRTFDLRLRPHHSKRPGVA
ncbi:hypothetical protein PG987_003535 [Apiospora arundinis]